MKIYPGVKRNSQNVEETCVFLSKVLLTKACFCNNVKTLLWKNHLKDYSNLDFQANWYKDWTDPRNT